MKGIPEYEKLRSMTSAGRDAGHFKVSAEGRMEA